MQFANEMQKNVHTMLASWFAEDIKNNIVFQHQNQPSFSLKSGSAIIYVMLNPMGDDDCAITVSATVVTGAKITPELMSFLLAHNHGALIGAFGVNPENGNITLDHSIVGSTCDPKELRTSISRVAATADKLDDAIIAKFGGKSALDVVRSSS